MKSMYYYILRFIQCVEYDMAINYIKLFKLYYNINKIKSTPPKIVSTCS